MKNLSVNPTSSHTFPPTAPDPRGRQHRCLSVLLVGSASRRAPRPYQPDSGEASPLVLRVSLKWPSLPGPSQATTFAESLIPSVLIPPAALLSRQHFLRRSADVLASRVCVRNVVLRRAQPVPAQHGAAAPMCSPTGPTSRISFSPLQNVRAGRTSKDRDKAQRGQNQGTPVSQERSQPEGS